MIEQLQDELRKLNNENENNQNQIMQLNQKINELNNELGNKNNDLINRDNIIKNLSSDKERLQKQINDKQNDFIDYQNSCQQEIELLQKKLFLLLEQEKNELTKNKNSNQNEIEDLKEQIKQNELKNKSQLEDCNKIDNKYNELVKLYEQKEKEHENEMDKLMKLNQKCNNDLELLKAKYEKKIQVLNLNNNELNSRVKNLINSLIALKDYAMSIEKNMNDAHLNLNGSPLNPQFLSLNNFNCENLDNNNLNVDKDKYSNELIQGMKDMISKIDSKINNNNEQFDFFNCNNC